MTIAPGASGKSILTRRLGRADDSVLAGSFGKWRFTRRLTTLAPPYDQAPTTVKVVNTSLGADDATDIEEDVEIIKE